jgi:hypothetical protein
MGAPLHAAWKEAARPESFSSLMPGEAKEGMPAWKRSGRQVRY